MEPFKLALIDCPDQMIECNEQKSLNGAFKRVTSNVYLGADLNRGVMKDIMEREDFSDSDEEMTEVVPHMNQVGQTDSFKLITNNNKDFNQHSFSNSLNKILSESS